MLIHPTCFSVISLCMYLQIPVDIVVNAMMMAMVANVNQNSSLPIIYHVGSSMRNPIKISSIHEFMHGYFTKHPRVDRNGKMIQVRKGTILDTWDKFQRYMAIRYLLPLKVKSLQFINILISIVFNFKS